MRSAGWAILNLLTLDPATRPIPVLVCSAAIHSLQEHAPMLEKHGIRALPKPFDLDDLLEAIQQTLDQGGLGYRQDVTPERQASREATEGNARRVRGIAPAVRLPEGRRCRRCR